MKQMLSGYPIEWNSLEMLIIIAITICLQEGFRKVNPVFYSGVW